MGKPVILRMRPISKYCFSLHCFHVSLFLSSSFFPFHFVVPFSNSYGGSVNSYGVGKVFCRLVSTRIGKT